MARKSSFNIQRASNNAFFHNARESKVSYTIDKKERNQCNLSGKEAVSKYQNLYREASLNYTKKFKQNIKAKNIMIEARIDIISKI